MKTIIKIKKRKLADLFLKKPQKHQIKLAPQKITEAVLKAIHGIT